MFVLREEKKKFGQVWERALLCLMFTLDYCKEEEPDRRSLTVHLAGRNEELHVKCFILILYKNKAYKLDC